MIIRTLRTTCILGTVAVLLGPGAVAQPDQSQIAVKRLLADPPMARANAQDHYDISVVMTDYHLYNPNTGKNDKVRLRTYWAPGMQPGSPLVGPTIEAKPGTSLFVDLHNKLPGKPGCKPAQHNVPECYDLTNFHTHGVWVTPRANSDGTQGDNVMITVDVGKDQAYRFDIPPEHPAGTFWYHAHVHGSTALQVASGMSGALIIHGNRAPTQKTNGDIDTLLAGATIKERILLFQQMAYWCPGARNNWDCTDRTGTIDTYIQVGGGKWTPSKRFTSINGEVLPEFPGAVAGTTERWRMIHGGIAATISVFLRAAKPGAEMPPRLSPIQAGRWIADNCTGEVVHQFSIAADGLTRSRIVDRGDNKPTTLQPGYREDVLVTFPKAGLYCVIDTATPIGVGQVRENRALLGVVRVAPGREVSNQRTDLRDQLVSAAQRAYMPDFAVAGKVLFDIKDGLKLTSFQPHNDLRAETNVGRQELAFVMGSPAMVATKLDGSNAVAYDGRMARTLKLGTTDEWTMTATSSSHPFHIHVNPFQIVKILDPSGKDVSESGEPGDTQYADLKGEWKDTIFIKQRYKVIMRTHYDRFDGVFVLHCHILDHEDTGMMEKIQICKPWGSCEPMGGGMDH